MGVFSDLSLDNDIERITKELEERKKEVLSWSNGLDWNEIVIRKNEIKTMESELRSLKKKREEELRAKRFLSRM